MTYQVLDTVVLERDLLEHGLRKGDLGAVVEVYEPDGLEVEFVTASGRTAALLTLSARDFRPVADDDLVSVRTCRPSASDRRITNRFSGPAAPAAEPNVGQTTRDSISDAT